MVLGLNSSAAWPSAAVAVGAQSSNGNRSKGPAFGSALLLHPSRRCGCQQPRIPLGLLCCSSSSSASSSPSSSSVTYQHSRSRILQTGSGAVAEHGSGTGSSFTNWELKQDANSSSVWGVHSCKSRISDGVVCQAGSGSGPFPANRRKMQSCKVAAAPQQEHCKPKGFISGSLEQQEHGNVCAREAVEANIGEASVSREEASGAIDRQNSINGYEGALTSTLVLDREPITGGAFDFRGATVPLTSRPLVKTKKIILVRHGLSAWNAEGRIQGSSDLSELSEEGIAQALRCKEALINLKFSSCFASPISRAKTSAEVIWSGREEPLVFLDTLKEANLLFLEGMRNVDAKEQYPEVYRTWREDPVNFQVNGVFPVVNLWAQAKRAWQEILSSEGELFLVVTHKSILRALMCTALGMGPDRFRAMDINNGGITVFTVNTRGEPLLQCLNMTAHLHVDGVYY
ncbi:unnamed protein product [Calypogeia fissa]